MICAATAHVALREEAIALRVTQVLALVAGTVVLVVHVLERDEETWPVAATFHAPARVVMIGARTAQIDAREDRTDATVTHVLTRVETTGVSAAQVEAREEVTEARAAHVEARVETMVPRVAQVLTRLEPTVVVVIAEPGLTVSE
jgi:hypothetical protein